MKTPIQLEFIKVSSYGNEFKSTGNVEIIDSKIPNLNDQNVLILDDICDTGRTAEKLLELFKNNYNTKKLRFATLINKKCNRVVDLEPDFYGFDVDDKFLVGYGLDYIGFYRNLPYVGWFPQ
jgi:hypoxanthine phosphoribosyltransferase